MVVTAHRQGQKMASVLEFIMIMESSFTIIIFYSPTLKVNQKRDNGYFSQIKKYT